MKKCLQCNSDKIIPSAMVLDRGEGHGEAKLNVGVDEAPDALIFKTRVRSELRASVCGECGYTELYAGNPTDLYRACKISTGEIKQ